MKKAESSPFFMLLIIIAMIIWAGAWSSAKLISNLVPGEVIVFIRLSISFSGMLPVVFFMGLPLKIPFKSFLYLLVSALLFTAYNQMFFKGLQTGLAGAGGVLVTTTNPIITYVLAVLIFKVKMSKKALAGLIIGLAGGAILLKFWTFDLHELLRAGNLYFITASFLWAILTIVSQGAQKQLHFIVYSCYLYGLGALVSLPFALPGGIGAAFNQGPVFYINILYLSIISMSFASTVYFLTSKKIGSHRASSFILIVPVSAPLISFFILKETPSWYTIIGGVIALSAVYLINSSKKEHTQKAGIK